MLVDEYQDTNHAQYVLLKLLAGGHRNLMVVGDPDQCLVAGTMVTMADGTKRPIEKVRVGRRGSVVLRQQRLPARPGRARSSLDVTRSGVAITTDVWAEDRLDA